MTLSGSSLCRSPDMGTATMWPWQPSPAQPPDCLVYQSEAKPLRKYPADAVCGQLSPLTAVNRAPPPVGPPARPGPPGFAGARPGGDADAGPAVAGGGTGSADVEA